MRVYKQNDFVILEGVFSGKPSTLSCEVNGNDISILNNNTGLYEVFEMLWSEIKDINNASLVDLTSTKAYLDSIFNSSSVEIDEEGRQISRLAAGKKGWVYMAHFFEFETSKDGSLVCEDWTGISDTSLSIKFYDDDGTEIINEGVYVSKQEHLDNKCVRTEVLFKPNYDYELISGNIRLDVESASDCKLWVVGGLIELGGPYVKEFARAMNLKFLGADEVIETDGRASKYMAKDIEGVPYQGNQLKFILKHPAGYKFKIIPTLEYFRA